MLWLELAVCLGVELKLIRIDAERDGNVNPLPGLTEYVLCAQHLVGTGGLSVGVQKRTSHTNSIAFIHSQGQHFR